MGFYKIILLVGIIQGLFLSSGLLVKTYGKKQVNYFFMGLIFVITVALCMRYAYDTFYHLLYPWVWYLSDGIAYIIGPLWYLTVQKSTQKNMKITRSDWAFFSPFLFYIGLLGFVGTLSHAELGEFYQSPYGLLPFYGFCLTVLWINGAFLWKAHVLLRKLPPSQFPAFLRYAQYAFTAILGIWLATFLASIFLANPGSVNLSAYNIAFLSFAFLTFGMAFLALVRPTSFYFLTQVYDSSEAFLLQEIAERIEKHLKAEQSFTKPGYGLADLSGEIGSNPVLTSKAINRILHTNFNDLVNQYRVHHFILLAKAESQKRFTLWALAQQVGFGNKVTFYKAFKKEMGTTPKAYLQQRG
ncbi:MAG: helix-turn-helix domain-containing protein [Bacteroidota bacterium]